MANSRVTIDIESKDACTLPLSEIHDAIEVEHRIICRSVIVSSPGRVKPLPSIYNTKIRIECEHALLFRVRGRARRFIYADVRPFDRGATCAAPVTRVIQRHRTGVRHVAYILT